MVYGDCSVGLVGLVGLIMIDGEWMLNSRESIEEEGCIYSGILMTSCYE